ncbi:MAG: hypothetical protein L6Q98_06025 [Anaerolineae bacterium]|nr:hypothetical protein [Anaerolineae bacterium]NUQ05699.1 hypothetical protein [Anaerolineae bacterium]
MARQFVRRLVIFATPIIIALCALFGMGLYLGDALPESVVVQLQDRSETVIYGGIDFGSMYHLKVLGANHYHPRLLIIGSSRVHTMGTFIVDDTADLYNAWLPGMNPGHAIHLMRSLDAEALPETIIWAIDHRFFSPQTELGTPPQNAADLDFQHMLKRTIIAGITLSRLIVTRSPLLQNVRSQTEPSSGFAAIGIDAQQGRTSLLARGAAFIGQSSIESYYAKLPEVRINEAGTAQFVPGDRVDETKLAVIHETLSFAQEHGIAVIGYLPAYSPLSYSQLRDNADYRYLSQIESVVAPIFRSYGFQFYDLTDPAQIPLSADEFIDGVHLTPRANLKLYRHLLLLVPEELEQFSSLDRLNQFLNSTQDPFLLDYYRSFSAVSSTASE